MGCRSATGSRMTSAARSLSAASSPAPSPPEESFEQPVDLVQNCRPWRQRPRIYSELVVQGAQSAPDLLRLQPRLANLDVLPEGHPEVVADEGAWLHQLRRRDDRRSAIGEKRADIDLPRQPLTRIGMQNHGARHDPGHDRMRPQVNDHVAAGSNRGGVHNRKPHFARNCRGGRDRALNQSSRTRHTMPTPRLNPSA